MPEQLSLNDQLHVRLQEKLRRELGAAVLDALADPRVIEVMLNPDGRLWIDELGVGMRDTGTQISAAQAENLLGTVAATLGYVITPERPVPESMHDARTCDRESKGAARHKWALVRMRRRGDSPL